MKFRLAHSLVMVLSSGLLFAKEPIGLVVSMKGKGEIHSKEGVRPAQIGTQLYVGDLIKTARAGSVHFVLKDKSTFSLAGDTAVKINTVLFDTNRAQTHIRLKQGTFEFLAGEISKVAPENFEIETETATIGIRGSGGTLRHVPGLGLLAQTMEGHVLEVVSLTGNRFLISDPRRGLVLHASGYGYYAVVNALFWNALNLPAPEVPSFSFPLPMNTQTDPRNFAIRPTSSLTFRRRFRVLDLKQPDPKLQPEKDPEPANGLKGRSIKIERETTSGFSILYSQSKAIVKHQNRSHSNRR